jgi:hypothetical protein
MGTVLLIKQDVRNLEKKLIGQQWNQLANVADSFKVMC